MRPQKSFVPVRGQLPRVGTGGGQGGDIKKGAGRSAGPVISTSLKIKTSGRKIWEKKKEWMAATETRTL